MLNHCLQWNKWVLTNFDHDRHWFNTLFLPLRESAAVTVDCISRLSGPVRLILRYTTVDIHWRDRRYEWDDGIKLKLPSHDRHDNCFSRLVQCVLSSLNVTFDALVYDPWSRLGVSSLSGSHVQNETEIKHCHWCWREIIQYFSFYFMFEAASRY